MTTLNLSECTGLTTIGYSAFNGCTSLTSVTLPSSIETIESGTFNGCTSLTSVKVTFAEKRFIDGEIKNAGTYDFTEAIKAGKEIDCFKLKALTGSETELKGAYHVTADTTLTGSDITLGGKVVFIVEEGVTLNVSGSITGGDGSVLSVYGAGKLNVTGDITADAINFYGGNLTANDLKASEMYHTWTNATDSIEVKADSIKVEGDGDKIILGKDFCGGDINVKVKDTVYTTTINTNTNKLYALSGCLVTVPKGMTIEGENARKITTAEDGTVAYDCVTGASVTVKPAEGHYFKGNDGKLSNEGKSYTVEESVLKKIELKATDYNLFTPDTIDGCSFNVDESGNGYYEISSADGSAGLAKYIGTGKTCKDLTFKLTADIKLSDDYTLEGFYGTLDGNGKFLANVTTNVNSNATFGHYGTVKNLNYQGSTGLSGENLTKYYTLDIGDANLTATPAESATKITFDGVDYYAQGSTFTIAAKDGYIQS